MQRFHEWLQAHDGRYGPKTPMGKAVRYALNNWDALSEFLKSEQIPLDNNQSEAALRIVALSRKNSLFVGHDEAGENLARVLTIGTTCEMAGVNPLEYLTDILLRIQTWPADRVAELLPASWKKLKDAGDLPAINAA
jgi:transposase